ncbi:hypothetical protein BDN72DRAFT_847181 [Pluteus cervinus]|uniref:Uncharacterized protein n=1 Tax=Pluteus cervinus TaxID=181527 RepID=A0ACD3AE34_9AGAR|nr:hypothetical protein BDN72DRAFT_847181 [Pluteus cervinus]
MALLSRLLPLLSFLLIAIVARIYVVRHESKDFSYQSASSGSAKDHRQSVPFAVETHTPTTDDGLEGGQADFTFSVMLLDLDGDITEDIPPVTPQPHPIRVVPRMVALAEAGAVVVHVGLGVVLLHVARVASSGISWRRSEVTFSGNRDGINYRFVGYNLIDMVTLEAAVDEAAAWIESITGAGASADMHYSCFQLHANDKWAGNLRISTKGEEIVVGDCELHHHVYITTMKHK